MSSLGETKATTTSTCSSKQESAHSKPSSLMTEEDWDLLLAKEQQQQENKNASDDKEMHKSIDASPIKKQGQHSTPSSPSELFRMTKRTEATGANRSMVEESKQFEKALGDWVSFIVPLFSCFDSPA